MSEKRREADIAFEILKGSKITLCGEIRSLLKAVEALKLTDTNEAESFLDGTALNYSPSHITSLFRAEENAVNRFFLHCLLHCLFLHIWENKEDVKLWNIACDMAVESFINSLSLPCTLTKNQKTREGILNELLKDVKNPTAENIYYHFLNRELNESDILKLEEAFHWDSHNFWYKKSSCSSPFLEDEETIEARSIYKRESEQGGTFQENALKKQIEAVNSQGEQDKDKWREITKQVIRDAENNPKVFGTARGGASLLLKSVTKDSYSYDELLRSFTDTNERLEINDDEFDYIYYTYGLSLYKNIPLIEPLEYAQNPKVSRLIIAIDTSGSVYGETVKSFVRKTYSLLKSTDFFKRGAQVHIIQCDCAIEDISIIKGESELEDYIAALTLKGFGGTDFTPVFDYAEALSEENPNDSINGVIYFTDGDGIYPEKAPDFKAAFVIHDKAFNKDRLPKWAISVFTDKIIN